MSVEPLDDMTAWNALRDTYGLIRELAAGETALATAAGNRPVVLKRLDPDCLSQSANQTKLHPSIHDRLSRVRELAHGRVANLHGVELYGGDAYLIWEYCDGETIDDWAMRKDVSSRHLVLAARELILILEALHVRGIVHGAIHGRNVIIDRLGNIKLTHLSPLLYSDPQTDIAAVSELFSGLSRRRGEADSPLDLLASEAQEPDATLRAMGARAGSLIDLRRDEESVTHERFADLRRRRRSQWAAAIVALVAILFFYGIHQYANRQSSRRPVPPEASPEAMR